MRIKQLGKQLGCLSIASLLAFSSSVYSAIEQEGAAMSDDTNPAVLHLKDDGTLVVPTIRVGNDHYTVTLQMLASQGFTAGKLFLPSFKVVDVAPVQVPEGMEGKNEHGFYDIATGKVDLPLVYINEKPYALVLTLVDSASLTFKLSNMSPADELSMLFLLTSTTTVSLLPEGTYGDKQVGMHFAVDAESHFVAFSDRPNRVAVHMEGGLAGFVDTYNSTNFLENPPNVTFGGKNVLSGKDEATVFEMSNPFVYEGQFIMPVVGAIGVEELPSLGVYSSANFVIDSWSLSDIGNIVSDGINMVANGGVATVDALSKVDSDTIKSTVDVLRFAMKTFVNSVQNSVQ